MMAELLPPTPLTLLEAMARQEGWYANGDIPNRPQRNSNPINLSYCPETISFGALRSDGRFAIFEDAETGWNAARRWLLVPARFDNGKLVGGYCGATLEQVIFRFAPPDENASSEYLDRVCAWTKLTPDTVVTAEIINEVRSEATA